jgi:hypothetical protein
VKSKEEYKNDEKIFIHYSNFHILEFLKQIFFTFFLDIKIFDSIELEFQFQQ